MVSKSLGFGGRAKKAPYETSHVRTPLPVKKIVEAIGEGYRDAVIRGNEESYLQDLKDRLEDSVGAFNKTLSKSNGYADLSATNKRLERELVEANKARNEAISDLNLTESHLGVLLTRLEVLRVTVEEAEQNSKNTRNWVEANRLIARLKDLMKGY